MADLAITALNVAMHATAPSTSLVVYGEDVTHGQVVYRHTDGTHKLAKSGGTKAEAAAVGIALTPGGANDSGIIAQKGSIDLGATLTVGEIYVLSETAGAIAPEADLVTGDYVTILGVASAADQLELNVNPTGVQVP